MILRPKNRKGNKHCGQEDELYSNVLRQHLSAHVFHVWLAWQQQQQQQLSSCYYFMDIIKYYQITSWINEQLFTDLRINNCCSMYHISEYGEFVQCLIRNHTRLEFKESNGLSLPIHQSIKTSTRNLINIHQCGTFQLNDYPLCYLH